MWLSGLGVIGQSKRSSVRSPVGAQAWVSGSVPGWECARGSRSMFLSHRCFSPSLPPSLPLSLKTYEIITPQPCVCQLSLLPTRSVSRVAQNDRRHSHCHCVSRGLQAGVGAGLPRHSDTRRAGFVAFSWRFSHRWRGNCTFQNAVFRGGFKKRSHIQT